MKKWIFILVMVLTPAVFIYNFLRVTPSINLPKETSAASVPSPQASLSQPLGAITHAVEENESALTFEKIRRFHKTNAKGERLYASTEMPGSGWKEGPVLGFGIVNPEPEKMNELRPLFQCELKSLTGDDFTYLTTSSVCDGYEARGKPLDLFLVATLIDSDFAPLYFCHTREVVIYNTLNPLCDHSKDQMNGVLGYLKIAPQNRINDNKVQNGRDTH